MAAFPRSVLVGLTLTLALTGCQGSTSSGSSGGSQAPATPAPRPTERAPTEATYVVSLRSNAAGTRWRGSQEISFTNTGAVPLDEVWLRTWGNGVDGCEPLAVEIADVSGGAPGPSREDCTALPVTFEQPLATGDRATVGFSLAIRVPELNDRFGVHGGLALLGNAIPTLAIHDAEGWHLDPYVHLGDSFFSEVARYRVTLDVPAALRTPATGTLVERVRTGAREVRTFVARDVRDFAWAAGGLDVVRGRADGAAVRLWYLQTSMSASLARRTLNDAIEAMTTFSSAFGAYPYPSVDIVTASFVSFGGMEYPRIVFSNVDRMTIAHELAHQWWYALVGNDEFAEPWLDESLATWSMRLPWLPWRRCDAYEWPSPTARLTNDMTYWGDHPHEFATVYFGGGCMLADLASRFGPARFTGMLERYASTYAFGVATTEDFQRLVERAAARHLEGFDAATYWETWRVG